MKLGLKETLPIINEQVNVEEEFCSTNYMGTP